MKIAKLLIHKWKLKNCKLTNENCTIAKFTNENEICKLNNFYFDLQKECIDW